MLFLISAVLFIWVDQSRIFLKEEYFQEKLDAAKLMKKAIEVISIHRLEQGVFIDEENDPNKTAIIGEKETSITTDRGSLNAKLTSLNPNMAASMIGLFNKAKLKKGDHIAVSSTGSLPGMNLAIYSAAKVMDLNLTVISSVGASMFGATDPDFTWLDMESLLNEENVFSYKSSAASLGGGRDLGRGLNVIGREAIKEAILRNDVELVLEASLEKNIERKMEIFESQDKIKLYINIGGGLSSLGNSINGKLIKPGFHRNVSIKNIPLKGTMFLFAEKNTPIIHLLDVVDFAESNDLAVAPVPLPEPGAGKVFIDERYNLSITTISLIILLVCIIVVIFFDHKQLKLKEDEIAKR